MSHSNIALFLPHRGCPHRCSFCNQVRITGQQTQITANDVHAAVETSLRYGTCDPKETEIAFFGGSFTAVDEAVQNELLSAASQYVKSNTVSGIRISTRPDGIDSQILTRLKSYGVTSIELGAQSMDDRVLEENGRGHTAKQVETASNLIRKFGFSLGLQMMTGLPGDTPDGALETAQRLADLKPDTMRIYPALVLEGTELADRYRAGTYQPMELDETVSLCSKLLDLFEARNIRVIRLGLHDSEEVRDRLAGPYHPSFAELCYSKRFLDRLTRELQERNIPQGSLEIAVHPRFLSKAIGQGKRNQKALEAIGYLVKFCGNEAIVPGAFLIKF